MSWVLGCAFENVGIAFDSFDKTWGGTTNSSMKRKDADPKKVIQIAFAGPWSEILFQARRKFPGCFLETTKDPLSMLDLIFNEDEAEDFVAHLSLPNGETQTITIDPNACSDDGCNALALAKSNRSQVERGLLEARQAVNEYWPSVSALAEELFKSPDQRIVIQFAEAERIVKKA